MTDRLAVYKMKPDKMTLPLNRASNELSVVHVSTFPRRARDIATFIQDLTHGMGEMLVPAVASRTASMNRSAVISYRYPWVDSSLDSFDNPAISVYILNRLSYTLMTGRFLN